MPYIPGVAIKNPEPLSRYLPQIHDGITSSWLSKNIPRGSWVLDPFCASPRLIVEAARAGYRILVTANNPIARFLLEMAASPPKKDDLKTALAELAASYKTNERMEPHIRALYNTRCARCSQIVSADAFLWEHGNPSPYMRIYTCPFCGDSGEHPCTPNDAEQVNRFFSSGLHKARALERVVAATDQDRIHVEQALSVYIPRALYALITIMNKIEGLSISSTSQNYLAALLLYAFDQGTAMWRYPGQKERRRQLTIPRQFRENNIWLALEQGIDLWSTSDFSGLGSSVPLSTWPEVPPTSGGICVYEGRLASIADSLTNIHINAVCTAIPRPNQAFWTLSALWAGWLWGREALGSFKSVLHRQRYDWGWHTTALTTIFKQLVNILEPSTPIFGLLSEAEPGFVASVLVAARLAGCGRQGIALRPEESQAQICWTSKYSSEQSMNYLPPIELGMVSAKSYLESRGEPANYLNTISAAFLNILQSSILMQEQQLGEKKTRTEINLKSADMSEPIEQSPTLIYSKLYNSAREALSYRSGFLQYNIQETSTAEATTGSKSIQDSLFPLDNETPKSDEEDVQNLAFTEGEVKSSIERERPTRSSDITESTYLWLRDVRNVTKLSISDRYELAMLDYMISHTTCTSEEINMMMCDTFPGLFTPDPEFIQICLESYGVRIVKEGVQWEIRPEDKPDSRQIDVNNMHQYIHKIAERLEISCTEQRLGESISAISWEDRSGDFDFWFYPTTTAAIGRIVLSSEKPPKRGIVILPGSRANLVMYKLQRDLRLSRAFNPTQGNWLFLKFRHLKSLAENPLLSRENVDQLLLLDPLTYSTPQLRLI